MAYQPVSNGAGGGPEGDDMPNDELGQIHLKMNQTTDEVSGIATYKPFLAGACRSLSAQTSSASEMRLIIRWCTVPPIFHIL